MFHKEHPSNRCLSVPDEQRVQAVMRVAYTSRLLVMHKHRLVSTFAGSIASDSSLELHMRKWDAQETFTLVNEFILSDRSGRWGGSGRVQQRDDTAD